MALYFVERTAQPTVFTSIPAAFWWAVVSLTTTGYGDMVPITLLGRLIASVMLIFGVGIFAIPTAVIIAAVLDADTQEEIEELHRRREQGLLTIVRAAAIADRGLRGQQLAADQIAGQQLIEPVGDASQAGIGIAVLVDEAVVADLEGQMKDAVGHGVHRIALEQAAGGAVSLDQMESGLAGRRRRRGAASTASGGCCEDRCSGRAGRQC
jgi:hypothetical protein